MDKKNEKANQKKKLVIFLALTVCLLLLAACRCYRYALQNRELLAALADRDQTIDANEQEIAWLQTQLIEVKPSMQEYVTEAGFLKKNGIYLIDRESQLKTLQQMVAEGAEIEPGIAAADASYRLRRSLEMERSGDDWFFIGTEDAPFCGSFDGDGHYISGEFPFMEGEDVPEAIFRTASVAKIANLEVHNQMYKSPNAEVYVTVNNDAECAEVENNLTTFPDCRVQVVMNDWELNAQKIADALRERWERNCEREGYYVSMSFYPFSVTKSDEEKYIQNILTPFGTLAGNEYKEIIEEARKQEEGYLRFVRLERIGEIICCSFEISEMGEGEHLEGDGYHIVLEGKWEGQEVQRQHLYIPYTEFERRSLGTYQNYRIECVDINFDGKQDLLIHEGVSGGSGGSWSNYRAIVWNGEAGQFAYYPSFPEQLTTLEFDRQRVISTGQTGVPCQWVRAYGVVNGEYVCTRELIYQTVPDGGGQNITKLSYYEMGELVQTHILSEWKERETLYPDMNYWVIG